MHAERLLSIALDTTHAFAEARVIKLLDVIIQDVANRQANPSDASLDQKVSEDTKKVFAALDDLSTGEFPPTWRKIMEKDLDLGVLFPNMIRSRIERAFEKKIMDSDVLESLKSLRREIQTRLEHRNCRKRLI